ncbi:MAG: hypothetical protein JSS39_11985 [Nitrospira sp.]|nr:hypothetical protein [Nitrospira sp.]
MKLWLSLLSILLLLVMLPFTGMPAEQTEIQSGPQNFSRGTSGTSDPYMGHATGGWEGSAEGKAYSEFQHHIVGLGDTLFGLAELGQALQYPRLLWTRLALPTILGAVGVYNLGWSDHDAWPIGSLGFVETFFGQDREIIEHKLCAVLALAIAVCEALRRTGRVRHPAWAAPLVLLTLVGSLLLFVHSHVNHPAAARIDLHHALLGSVGVCAGLSKGLASWLPGASPHVKKRWEVAWGGCVILFGLLLLVYSE